LPVFDQRWGVSKLWCEKWHKFLCRERC
jgi:hypothetical protein